MGVAGASVPLRGMVDALDALLRGLAFVAMNRLDPVS